VGDLLYTARSNKLALWENTPSPSSTRSHTAPSPSSSSACKNIVPKNPRLNRLTLHKPKKFQISKKLIRRTHNGPIQYHMMTPPCRNIDTKFPIPFFPQLCKPIEPHTKLLPMTMNIDTNSYNASKFPPLCPFLPFLSHKTQLPTELKHRSHRPWPTLAPTKSRSLPMARPHLSPAATLPNATDKAPP